MKTLALDTTGPDCGVALIDGEKILATERTSIGHGHAEYIGPQTQRILNHHQIRVADLDRIVVCTGPGSFTGLRVALSFAKGLALPFAIPQLGVSALQLWAAEADPEQSKTVFSVHDARRSELFGQLIENGQAVAPPKLYTPEDARKVKVDIVCGSGAHILGVESSTAIDPALLAWIGAELDPEAHPAAPLYQRPPDAKLPTKKRRKLV